MRIGTYRALIAILLGLAFGPARLVEASAFHVNPIRVDFNRNTSSTLLTLTNESSDELRFQISAFQWGQDNKGEMKLTPTEDIVFFPALLTLKPAESRKVRVGTAKPVAGSIERTYRIFFEELPPVDNKNEAGAQVKIITKMGIPIFVSADKPAAQPDITSASVNHGKLTFDVRNGGNTHFIVQTIRVIGRDGAGKTIFDKQREGWYVLAGGVRSYDMDLGPAECANLKSLRVEAQTDISPKADESVVKRDLTVDSHTCAK